MTGAFPPVFTVGWSVVSVVVMVNPSAFFRLLGRRKGPLSPRLTLSFRVLGVLNLIGSLNLIATHFGLF